MPANPGHNPTQLHSTDSSRNFPGLNLYSPKQIKKHESLCSAQLPFVKVYFCLNQNKFVSMILSFLSELFL